MRLATCRFHDAPLEHAPDEFWFGHWKNAVTDAACASLDTVIANGTLITDLSSPDEWRKLTERIATSAAEPLNAYWAYVHARRFVEECEAFQERWAPGGRQTFQRHETFQRARDMELLARNKWFGLVL